MIKAVLGKFGKKGAAEAELRKSSWRWHHPPRPPMTIPPAPRTLRRHPCAKEEEVASQPKMILGAQEKRTH